MNLQKVEGKWVLEHVNGVERKSETMTYDELLDLAKRLGICLADEVEFAGIDAAERSLIVLKEASKNWTFKKNLKRLIHFRLIGRTRESSEG